MNQNYDFIASLIAVGTAGTMLLRSPASATLPRLGEYAPAASTVAAEQAPNRIGTSSADRVWDEAFANTTDEQFARLEQLFIENELKYGTELLDLAER